MATYSPKRVRFYFFLMVLSGVLGAALIEFAPPTARQIIPILSFVWTLLAFLANQSGRNWGRLTPLDVYERARRGELMTSSTMKFMTVASVIMVVLAMCVLIAK